MNAVKIRNKVLTWHIFVTFPDMSSIIIVCMDFELFCG